MTLAKVNATGVLGSRSDGRPIYGFAGGAYDNVTSRTDVAALIPEQVSNEMLGKATEDSATMNLFRRLPVSGTQMRFPILSALPVAYWVNGDTGLKQTTEIGWSNKYLQIEEIATIMPVPDNVAEDVSVNVYDEAMPLLIEAFARTLDAAVFFGTNAPGSFPTNVVAAAAAAGNFVNVGTSNAAAGGIIGDTDKLIGLIEQDGYEVTGWMAPISTRGLYRAARDTTGQKIDAGRISNDFRSFDGAPVLYPMRGLWPVAGGAGVNGVALLGGDWTQFIVGVKNQIEVKVLTEAVITDNTGAIIFNLPQQDMTAIRLKFRVGWQVANTINNQQPNAANRYPIGYLKTVGA